jgi:Fe-S-cluster-containing dehydrogenase component/CRP-like cAMP-binding protein
MSKRPVQRKTVTRPQRWDNPFSPDMTDTDVEFLLDVTEIKAIQAKRFPARVSLDGILRNDTKIVPYKKGELVVREGDYGNSAFLILQGKLRVVLSPSLSAASLGRAEEQKRGVFDVVSQLWTNTWLPETRATKSNAPKAFETVRKSVNSRIILQDVPAILDKHATDLIEEGALFGELAALGRIPRSSTVLADEDCLLLEIRWQGLRELRNYDEGWRRMIDERYRKTALTSHLNEVAEFDHLNDAQIQEVADRCIFETYGTFDWYTSFQKLRSQGEVDEPVIVRQGDYPDGMLMVRAGFAREAVQHGTGKRTVTYLGAGDNFGLYELYNEWADPEYSGLAVSTTLTAVGYVDVVRVPASVLAEFVFPNIEPPENKIQMAEGKSVADDALMQWAVDERFINGRQAMVMDLDKCVRCDDCVLACAAAHGGNPRFKRHGKTIDHWMVSNACMHCVDPVCMIGCPTGAIHRSINGGAVIINDDSCIGCGTCANSCPYQNISLVHIADSKGHGLFDDQTERPIMKATKCDLCVDQIGGPACVQACPHDALQRVDFQEFSEG